MSLKDASQRVKITKSISLIEQLDRELTCQFCLGLFQDPRMLECLHSYCYQCIASLEIKDMPSLYKCPECKETHKIPDLDQLPVHKIANKKKRDFLLLRRISGEEMKCSLCPVPHKHAAPAIYICFDCREDQQFFCHNCSGNHYKKPELKDHQLELLNTLIQSTVSVDTGTSGAARRTMMSKATVFSNVCDAHGLQLRFFCETCKASICGDCRSEFHPDHATASTTSALEDIKQIIPTELLYVIGIRDGLQHSLEPITEAKEKIKDQKEYLSEEIHARVNRISKDLEHQEKILQKQLDSSAEGKLNMLSKQISEINKLIGKADQLSTMLIDADTLLYQSDILSVAHTLLDKVDALKKEYNAAVSISRSQLPSRLAALKNQLTLTPCEEANLGLIMNTDVIKREVREESRIFLTTACPELCSAMGPALKNPETLRLTYFHVHLKNTEGDPCVSLQNVQISIMMQNKKEIHPKISHRKSGIYTVSFCFEESGLCTIDILVNKTHINQSPFHVSVAASSPIAGDSKFFESAAGVTVPVGIVKDSHGNILVTNKAPDSKVLVLDQRGMEIMRIQDEQHMLKDPCGIAVDSEENIYVTSSFYHCILKYSSSGQYIKSTGKIGRQKDNFQNPAGISIKNDELFVCDASNCRVSVFDNELRFKRQISTDLTGKQNLLSSPSYPYDVTFDAAGFMFVSDTVNDCILVFKDDTLASAFQQIGEDDHLQVPKGITIDDDGYLFVCDSGNHRIAVFRCFGEPITTLSLQTEKRGHKFTPSGITTDNNGSLYVCDQSNKRVVVLSDTSAKLAML